MTWKEIGLWLVLADFLGLTVWAVYSEGYFAFVPVATAFAAGNPWGAQILVDFLLAVAVGLGFVVADARRRGARVWPFVALTLTLGSIGLLGYLIHRERSGAGAGATAIASARGPAPQHA